ncbi:MAG: hypothetical protein ACE148_14820 [Vicinamibacterales bacterium]
MRGAAGALRHGQPGSFTVTTSGFPAPSVGETGALPTGVTFTDNGDGTATIAGMPAAGTGRSYALTISASNGVGDAAYQAFTRTVHEAPAITSANQATFTVGSFGSFIVSATGYPVPAVSRSGSPPAGVVFTDNGNGSATSAGTPAAATGGTYALTITASNGMGSPAQQGFTLTVLESPAITSGSAATFSVGAPGSFTVTATGFPLPYITRTGALPAGVTFVDNGNGTAAIAGTMKRRSGRAGLAWPCRCRQARRSPPAPTRSSPFCSSRAAAQGGWKRRSASVTRRRQGQSRRAPERSCQPRGMTRALW